MDPAIESDFPNPTTSPTAGFTLIELLICVAVLSVLAFGASLALPRGSSAAGRDMALFQRHYAQQRQQAISGQNSVGIALNAKGLRLARRQPGASQQIRGQDTGRPYNADRPLNTGLHDDMTTSLIWQVSPQYIRWQGRVTFSSATGGSRTINPVQIQFLADGRSSAFAIRFSDGSSRQANCRSDGWTGLICESS